MWKIVLLVDRLLDHYGDAAVRRTQESDVTVLDTHPGVVIDTHSYCGSMDEKQDPLALGGKPDDGSDRGIALHEHGDTPQSAVSSGLG